MELKERRQKLIKVENINVWGFEHAIRGMRNPMNSWDRSDSEYEPANFCDSNFIIGDNDLSLMKKLYKAGHPHRKYLRQIMVSMDITAPLYWWKEFDTYKVGTTANSCSTMHKIAAKEFEVDDFSYEHLFSLDTLRMIIQDLNYNRDKFIETKNKDYWWQLIQLLPSSYNQRRTITMNYENVMNMLDYRDPHKLDEWNEFCGILKLLPYITEIREDEETS